MKCCNLDPRSYFLFWARILFGAWLLYAGLVKIFVMGPSNFVAFIVGDFANTWSPAPLNTILAWIILIAEPILGILLIIGKSPRCVWTATTLLMFLLTFGMTMLQKQGVADNWMYTIFALVCAALSANKSDCCDATGCCNEGPAEKASCCSAPTKIGVD